MKFKKKIVLVDADLHFGLSIVEILILNNFEVQWFKDGLEALTYLKRKSCDAVISEFTIPSLSGDDLFLEIQNHLKQNSIPFFMISAKVNKLVKIRQLENGVNDFMTKPFNVKELLFKVQNILAFKQNIIKKYTPDPFSKVTIKLSEKDFITLLNEKLLNSKMATMDITELSKVLYMSKSTIDKKIRKHTNKNTSQYIREFKLDYAIKLMKLGEKNIQSIVIESGFNSFSYFSTCFKTYVGMSARDYIKSLPN